MTAWMNLEDVMLIEISQTYKDKHCMIKDVESNEVFTVEMKGKSFALDMMKQEQATKLKEERNEMKTSLMEGQPESKEELPTCPAYQCEKQTKLSFQKNKTWRAKQKLQSIQTEV